MESILLELKKYTKFSKQQTAAIKVIHYEGEVIPEHEHDFFELVVVCKGDGFHVIDGVRFSIFPNEVFLIFPGQKHHYEDQTHLSLLTFMFNFSILEPHLEILNYIEGFQKIFNEKSSLKQLHFVDDLTVSLLDNLVFRIAEEQMNMRPGFPVMLMILQLEALMLIFRKCFDVSAEEAAGTNRLAPVISYVTKNYHVKLTLKNLASVAGMSVPSFCRFFRSRMNMSPIQYLLNFRIKKAKSLLANSSLSVSEIAEKTGFNDANYFSRQFVRIVGVQPHIYRDNDHGFLHTPGMDLKRAPDVDRKSGSSIKLVE